MFGSKKLRKLQIESEVHLEVLMQQSKNIEVLIELVQVLNNRVTKLEQERV